MKAQVLGYIRVQKFRDGEYELWIRNQRGEIAIRLAHSLPGPEAERLRNEINNLLNEVHNSEFQPENTPARPSAEPTPSDS